MLKSFRGILSEFGADRAIFNTSLTRIIQAITVGILSP